MLDIKKDARPNVVELVTRIPKRLKLSSYDQLEKILKNCKHFEQPSFYNGATKKKDPKAKVVELVTIIPKHFKSPAYDMCAYVSVSFVSTVFIFWPKVYFLEFSKVDDFPKRFQMLIDIIYQTRCLNKSIIIFLYY